MARFSVCPEDPYSGPPGAVVIDSRSEMGNVSCDDKDAPDVCNALNMWSEHRDKLFKIFDQVADRVLGDKYDE